MPEHIYKHLRTGVFALGALFSALAAAQSSAPPIYPGVSIPETFEPDAVRANVPVYVEYDKRLRASEKLAALGSDLFGEQVSMYTGQTLFRHVDIDVPGNNDLPVQLSRRYMIAPLVANQTFDARGGPGNPYGGLANWDIEVPYVYGIFDSTFGWDIPVGATTQQPRCSQYFSPRISAGGLSVTDVWSGVKVNIPGSAEKELLRLDPSYPPLQYPSDGRPATWTTSDFDAFRCITLSPASNEGFVMTTRQGVSYRFDVYTERTVPTVTSGSQSNARKAVFLLASEVTDRYGNWVRYFYNNSGHPMSITASDGRSITLTYDQNRLQSASITLSAPAETRTWTYGYTQQPDTLQRLTSVTLPDNVSTWQFDYQSLNPPSPFTYLYVTYLPPKPSGSECLPPEISTPGGDFGLRITHPSGANGDFRFKLERSDRYNLGPSNCQVQPGGGGKFVVAPYVDAFRLKSKTISDTASSSQQWSYAYGPVNDDRHVRTTVTQPDGSVVQNDFSAVHGATVAGAPAGSAVEGQLVATATIQGGVTLRTQTNTYVTGPDTAFGPLAGYSFPSRYGGGAGGDDGASGSVRPLLSTTTTLPQQGVTLARTNQSFDAMARPLQVKRESKLLSGGSVLHSKTETTAFEDKRAIWVLDLVDTLTDSTLPSTPQINNDYDGVGNLTRAAAFGREQRTMTWRPDGTLQTLTVGPHTTTLGTFKRGVPQSVTYADNTGVSAVVDDAGDIRSVTDENGFTTSYGFDKLRRLTGIAYPAGDTVNWQPTGIQYDFVSSDPAAGFTGPHWRQTTSTGNARIVAHYDQRMRPRLTAEYDIAAIAATERYTRRSFDHADRETFVSFPASSPSANAGTTTTYDALGRVTATTRDSELGTLTTSTAYTSPFKTQFTNARGKTTSTTFQIFDEPSESAPLVIEEPLGTTTAFTRDSFGKPLTMTRSGTYNGSAVSVVRRYVYDQSQMLCKTVEPESGATVISYNASNLVEWKASGQALADPVLCQRDLVAANQKASYEYDDRDRLWRTQFGDNSPEIVITYTDDGLPKTVASDNSLWTTAYNKRRLMTGETLQLNETTSYVLGYTHTPNGHVSSLAYPDGTNVAYAPNALGQATQVGNYASQITWYPNGGLKSLRYGNNVLHTTEQNTRGLPSRSLDVGVLDDRYVYDENGNVKSIVDDLSSAFTRTMNYDDRDRLKDATNTSLWNGNGVHSFIYDPLDNLRQTINPTSGDWTYVYNATTQRLDRINSTTSGSAILTYGYDTRGRAIARGSPSSSLSFTVDLADRVKEIPSLASYRYDGHGRRTSVTKAGTTTAQVYSQAGQLMYQSSPSSSDGIFRNGFQTNDPPYPPASGGSTRYIYLGRHLIAEDGASGRKYIHTDGLGSPARTSNQAGTAAAREDYKPYGWGPIAQSKPGFTGHVADAETGLMYMQARYYDPFAGRFLATDPIAASATSFNRYWYANNNPYKFVDPDGRDGCAASRIAAVCAQYGWANAVSATVQGDLKEKSQVALNTITAPWGGWDGFRESIACTWKCGLPGDGSAESILVGLPAFAPVRAFSKGGGAAATAVPQVLRNQAAGNAARDAIAAARPGSLIEQVFRVTGGLRRVDVLDALTAIESKVGRTSLTAAVRQELARDIKLLRSGQVEAVQWHFSVSPITGLGGPTGPLRAALEKFGILIVE